MKLPFLRDVRRDIVAFAIALVALTILLVLLSTGGVLFSRPLWADEIQTMMAASHASPLQVIADLLYPVDHGPPLLHLVVWGAGRIGLDSPVMLRAMALGCVLAALVIVYAVLRHVFRQEASAAGALAVGAHSLVIAQAFEARYYGWWLLFCALFAWCLGDRKPGASRRRRDVRLGIVAVLLCLTHWYGVITLGLMSAGVLLSYGRRWREAMRELTPALAGIIAFIACVPLGVRQRASVSIPSWVPDLSTRQLAATADIFWTAMVPALAVVVLVVASTFGARRDGAYTFGEIAGNTTREPSLMALAALALLPLALAVLSLMGQSSVFPRYAIPAALAWAPLVGLALETAGRWTTRAFVALLVALWIVNFVRLSQHYENFAVRTRQQEAEWRNAQRSGIPVVFQSMHTLYAVAAHDWPRRSPANFLELSDSTFAQLFPAGVVYQVNKTFIIERDIARLHARRFGFPTLVQKPALDATARFLLLLDETEFPRGYSPEAFARAVFPHHQSRQVSSSLWLFQRVDGARAAGAMDGKGGEH